MTGEGSGHLLDVNFDDSLIGSPFIRPVRMNFNRRGMKMFWDLALEHDNVAVLLFHRKNKCFVLVKQFRPPVFVQRIRQMPENVGKSLNSIDWSSYSLSIGETVELCAGLMDKKGKNPLETIHEEIVEECGYSVDIAKIEKIKIYMTGVGISGSCQHLFFAEVDDTMKLSEGGGVISEGEIIEKVFLALSDARELLDEKGSVDSPPSMLFALSWFFRNKKSLIDEFSDSA